MMAVIVDTNILVVANQKSSHASPDCVLACVNILEKIKENKIIAVDSGGKIFEEYLNNANLSGQPGVGDAFLKWLYRNQWLQKFCEQVDITPIIDDHDNFAEFPNDPELSRFDRSDRKFVAVALTCRYETVILNATDSDWWYFRKALSNNGLKIQFLCPKLVKKIK